MTFIELTSLVFSVAAIMGAWVLVNLVNGLEARVSRLEERLARIYHPSNRRTYYDEGEGFL